MWRFGGQRGRPTPTGHWNPPVDRLVDHRSYKRQGIDKIPSVHLGPAIAKWKKRGIRTDKGEVNRQIAADNKLLKSKGSHYPPLQLV